MSGMMGRIAVRARQGALILAVGLLGMLTLVGCGLPVQSGTTGASPLPSTFPEQLEVAGKHLDQAISAAEANDMPRVLLAYQDFNVVWMQIQDPIWRHSQESQIAIQKAVDNVDNVLLVPGVTPDKDKAVHALKQLRQVVNEQEIKLGS